MSYSTMDNRLALISGIDFPIVELETVIHQPSIMEISYLGETQFFTGLQCLCIHKTMCIDDPQILAQITNFEVFQTIMGEATMADKKEAVIAVLGLLFPGAKVIFTPRSISLNRDGAFVILDENNFEILQSVLEQMFCLRKSDEASFNPGSSAAKKIADKLMKARERLAAEKAQKGDKGSSLGQYVSILTVGVGSMSLKDTLGLTMYQMYDLVERYMLYMNWDIDLRSRLMGGGADQKPDNWMKNLH